jgi:hypothetical protein
MRALDDVGRPQVQSRADSLVALLVRNDLGRIPCAKHTKLAPAYGPVESDMGFMLQSKRPACHAALIAQDQCKVRCLRQS